MRPDHPEIGRELRVSDLKVGTTVVGRKECHQIPTTAWVLYVGRVFVALELGEVNQVVMLIIQEDGTLRDDTGIKVGVYEYLGTI